MDTIQLSVRDSSLRNQLDRVLGNSYQVHRKVEPKDPSEIFVEGDLLVVDLKSLRQWKRTDIEVFSNRGGDRPIPMLLLVPDSQFSDLDSDVWAVVDDVVGTPLRPSEVKGRVQALLRRGPEAQESEEGQDREFSGSEAHFSRSSVGLMLLEDGEIREANDRAGELLGVSPRALSGQALSAFSSDPQPSDSAPTKTLDALLRMAQTEGEVHSEWMFDSPDREAFWVDLVLSSVPSLGDEYVQVAIRSMTSPENVHDQLEQSRERLATAQRIAGLGSWERDFERDELYWSDETRRIFGWEAQESVTVEKFMSSVHPDDREDLRRKQELLYEEGDPIDVEYRIVRPDGEERILHERGEAEFAEDGTLRRVSGTVLDVTEQKEKEQRLRILSQALEQTQEAVFITEAVPVEESWSPFIYVNAAFEEMTGFREEEVLGRSPQILFGTQTDPEVLDSLRRALEAGRSWEGETVNYRKDGQPYRVRWTVAPVRCAEGDIDYWVSVQRDVTEEREQEEALRQQRNLLEQTQRLAGAWEIDLRSEEVSWSEEVYRIHEVEPGTTVSIEDGIEFYAPEVQPQIREAFDQCIEEGEPYDLELPLITAKGNRRWVRTVGAPVEDDGTVVKVAGAFQDITEQKEAEQALQDREAHLRGLANSIPGVVFQAYERPDGTYGSHFVSEQAEELLSISADPEGFHSRFAERIPASHREEFLASVEAAFEAEAPWRLEVPFVKPSGEQIWLLGLSTPERRDDELVFNGVLLDISERKGTERILREERDRFATLFHNLPTPVAHGEADANNRIRIRAVNAAFEAVFGYERDEILGRDVQEVIVPDSEEASAESVRRSLLAGEMVDREVRRQTVNGVRDFRLQVALREGDEGPAEGYAIYTDVTEERRRHQRQERQQEALLELMNLESVIAGNFDAAVQQITERASEVLEVARANVWLFGDDGVLHCVDHYDRAAGTHSAGMELDPEAYSSYFKALSDHHVLEAQDAHSDPRTEELTEAYLQPHDIGALLDATLHSEGEVIGVLCHEHVGESREWTTDELQFAGEVADIVHRALRNQKEAERRREMAFQRSLLEAQQEAVLDGLLVVDETGTIVSYNDRFVEMWGLPEDLPEQGDDHAVLEAGRAEVENPEEFLERVEYLYEHPEKRSRDEIVMSDGRVFDRYTTPLTGEDGVHYGRLWTFRDITQRKNTEQEVRETKQLLEKTLESLNEAVLVVDPSAREIVTCNAAVIEIFGYEKEELIGESSKILHVDREAYEAFGAMSEPVLDEEGSFSCEYRMRRKDGQIIDTEHVLTPLRGDEWPLGVVSVIRDITQRKETQRKLEESEQRYRTLAENFPNGAVGVYDYDLRYTLVAGASIGDTLPPQDEFEGTRMPDLFPEHTAADIEPLFRAAIEEGTTDSVETEFGDRIWKVWATPLRDADGKIFAGLSFAQDITELKQREKHLEEARETAEEANRLKTAMLANMSHEIRTPLTSIIGFSEILADHLEGELSAHSERIQESSRRLMQTIDSVLELSKLEAGVYELPREPVQLDRVVRETVELLRPRAREHDVDLETDHPTEPVEGLWNEGALNRIVENLLENAIKFTPEGGRVLIRVVEGEEVVLHVEDTGIGIGESALPHIFEAFKQESEGLDREYEGSGLGLSIVEKLTEALGGEISVESEKGTGTHFAVQLPKRAQEV